MHSPLISLISVTRNDAEGLQKTLTSVTEQVFKDFEYIVIDGGSTDRSIELIREFEDGIDSWSSEPDSGIYNAMNKGIAAARGEYLLFLNSGDHLLNRHSLEKSVRWLGNHDLCCFDIEVRQPPGSNSIPAWIRQGPDIPRFSDFVRNSLPHQSCFIRRSLFERYGYYDETLKICSDWKAFMLWVCKHGCSYKHVHDVLSVFYIGGVSSHPESRPTEAAERQMVLETEFSSFLQDGLDACEAREALVHIAALRRSRVIRSLQAAGVLWKF